MRRESDISANRKQRFLLALLRWAGLSLGTRSFLAWSLSVWLSAAHLEQVVNKFITRRKTVENQNVILLVLKNFPI